MSQPSPGGGKFPCSPSPRAVVDQTWPKAGIASRSPMTNEHLPAHFGRYRIIEEIARGGMGVVYHGVHDETGVHVALKTLLDVSPRDLAAFRREIRALHRVRHPGIVHLLDVGETQGRPWVAMPFLQGRTLSDYLKGLWANSAGGDTTADKRTLSLTIPVGDPLPTVVAPAQSAPTRPLGPTLTLIRRLCAPLAFLHGEGLVHRDLKPGNVFLRENDHPMLIDLGLAVHRGVGGREELDVDSNAGTPTYMAPEQFRGELVDARADLYALGCILYKCVTGQPPFSDESRGLCFQHLYDAPIPPSQRVPGLPLKLDDLILRLLEKDPQARMGYAADVAAELVALGAAAEPDDGPPPQAYLYNPALAGREDDLATLKEKVTFAISQRRGGLVLLRGESGVGKTRLAREISRQDERRITVIMGDCVAPGAGEVGATAAVASPLYPLLPVLHAAADRARSSRVEAERLFGPRSKVLAAYAPELRNLPGYADQPEPASLPPEKARARVIASLRETIWALAAPTPLLIVLDNLQWADDLTLSLLEALVKAGTADRGVLIVATYRTEEARPELAALGRLPGVTTISLGRLDRASLAEMVSGMLARRAPPEAMIDALVNHSNGNPFFVAEYLRAAIRAGILRRDEEGHFCFDTHSSGTALASLSLPHTLADLIERRLNQLDPEAQELAEWAAVLAQDLDVDLLRGGARSDSAAMEALEALMARLILEETEEGRLRFAHDKIREIAYQRIDGAKRAEMHRRAGEALESQYADAPDKAPALGHHFTRAGLHAKGGRYFARAADRARQLYTNADAVRLYRAAIDALALAGGEFAELAKLHEHQGEVLGLIGRQEEARDAYRTALAMISPSACLALAGLYRKIGKTWEMRHQHAKALELYTQAEDSLGSAPPWNSSASERPIAQAPFTSTELWWHEWLQIQLDRISVYYWKAELEPLCARIEAIRRVVAPRGTALQRGHYFHALTQRNLQIERFVPSAATVGYARKSVTAYEAAGEAREGHWVLSARFTLAFLLMLHGSLEEAEEQMNAALLAGEQSHDLEVQTRCLTYLTVIHRRLGRLGSAEKLAQRSLSLAKAEQVNEYAGAANGTLSWIAISRGDYAEAERAGREALAYWEPLALVYPFQWLARLPLCFVALTQDRLHDAVDQARSVLDLRQQRLPRRLASKLEAALLIFAEGRAAHVERVLLEALRIAQERGYA